MYGATDVGGSMLVCNPNLPVYARECQSMALGYDVRALHQGQMGLPAPIGEVVLANPFPSRPLGLLNDHDGSRFHEAYFAKNPGFWTQGDFVEFYADGGARLHGRCDGVLNIRGVRIGPIEIYDALDTVPEVTAVLAVAQAWPDAPGGERLVLLVTLKEGIDLDEPSTQRIKAEIGRRASTVHVPDAIAQVAELPLTHNGKLSERAAADAINGREVVNLAALRNPECLELIAAHPALRHSADLFGEITPMQAKESTEAVVKRVWERIFGYGPLQSSDDFFDLGGDSLTAIQIFKALNEALVTNLPPTLLYRAPTIGSLAEEIELHGDDDVAPPYWITLKEGSGAPPVFILPGIDGTVMKLRSLARIIKYRGAIIGVQARGIQGKAEALSSIDDMARFYLEVIRTIQPHGPYLLSGYSLGGVVAIEVARILRSEGEEVLPLLLLDAPIDEKEWPTTIWIETLFTKLRIYAAPIWQASGEQRWKVITNRLLGVFQHFLRRYGSEAQRHRVSGHAVKDLPADIQRVYDNSVAASVKYSQRRFDGPIVLFVASRGVYEWCNVKDIWAPFAPHLTVHYVPGAHESMLVPPENQVLASALSECLAERRTMHVVQASSTCANGAAERGDVAL
jgi:acetoacetyl-CoA synthetase